jgi:hypothetical protein
MKLQHLSALAFVAVSLASLACSAPDDDIFMGGDDESAGSGGSSAGTQQDAGGSGNSSGGKSQGGSSSSGGSSNDEGGTASGGTPSGGAGGSGSGGTDPGEWDPCAGKACGDLCSPCNPNDPNCIAVAVEMTCSATGQCSIGRPACTIPKCEGTQQYYAPGCNSLARPSGPVGTFTAGCYDACTEGKCADGFICRTVWYDPSASCTAGQGCIAACGAEASICIAN